MGILGMLAVAIAIAWRARPSWRVAVAISASFLALFPVVAWGPFAKPDPLAVTLTAFAVTSAGERWWRAAASGALAALAIATKPTALLPIATVLAYLWWRERRTAVRVTLALAASALVVVVATLMRFDGEGVVTHVVRWNVLPYSPAIFASLVLVGLLTFGTFAALGALRGDARLRAYVAGSLLVVALGGREGATINYLLDLAAASCLALASGLREDRLVPAIALPAQLVAGVVVVALGAFGLTGAWGDRQRVTLAADLPRTAPHLAEDSGVLLANGIEPAVDDLFLWSRLVAGGTIRDDITPRARDGQFAAVISEVPLDVLETAPGFERQRWSPVLVRAVLGSYRLEIGTPGHYRYVPRRGFVLSETGP